MTGQATVIINKNILNNKTNKMKKTHLFLIAAIVMATLFTQKADAKIWRVNNRSNYDGLTLYGDNFGGTTGYPVFTQIQQVVPLASSGDTIYVEASPLPYSAATVDRKLIIIGSGYFLSQNPHVSTNTDSSFIAGITFASGSEGSQLVGMTEIGSNDYIYINVSDITIKRCHVFHAITIASSLNDVYILENFFPLDNSGLISGSSPYPTDLVFNNNICQKALIWNGSILQCNNNIFDGPTGQLTLSFKTSEFKNNILKALNTTTNINSGSNLNVSYNVGTSATQFGTANNNIVVASINSLFVSSASPDGSYQILSGSVASNSGSDGTDRGAFGGVAVTDRYTLSGLAAIPVIYSVSTPGTTTTNLPVIIQARTIK